MSAGCRDLGLGGHEAGHLGAHRASVQLPSERLGWVEATMRERNRTNGDDIFVLLLISRETATHSNRKPREGLADVPVEQSQFKTDLRRAYVRGGRGLRVRNSGRLGGARCLLRLGGGFLVRRHKHTVDGCLVFFQYGSFLERVRNDPEGS